MSLLKLLVDQQSLHDLALLNQRRIRNIRAQFPTSVPLEQAIIVPHIYSLDSVRATDLSQYFGISKSKVTRIIQGLRNKGYIEVEQANQDRRERFFTFTEVGEQLVEELIATGNSVAANSLLSLSNKEQKQFISYIKLVADGLDMPTASKLKGQHPLYPQQRRFVRFFGLLGNEHLDTGLTSLQYHAMLDLVGSKKPVTFKALADALPFPKPQLSLELTELAERNFITKKQDPNDQRGVLFSLSPNGRRKFDRLRKRLNGLFIEAISTRPKKELKESVSLFEKLITAGVPGELELESEPFSIVENKQERQRQEARAFYVERLVSRGKHHDLPELIIPKSSTSFALRNSGGIKAVCEFSNKNGDWSLVAFLAARTVSVEAQVDFLLHCVDALKKSARGVQIDLKRSLLRDEVVKRIEKEGSYCWAQ